jgi:lipoprotein-anchoring transpeptidase ErfK/SrfK
MDAAMIGMKTAGKGLLALVIALSSLVPASAQGLQPGWRFAPPPGVTIVQGKPRHALQLQANAQVNPVYLRQVVQYPTGERSGTIVVDTRAHFLYFVLGDGRALRYGIGVAKSGFEWSGAGRTCRAIWRAGRTIRWARGRSIWARRSIASTERPSPGASGRMCRPAASA